MIDQAKIAEALRGLRSALREFARLVREFVAKVRAYCSVLIETATDYAWTGWAMLDAALDRRADQWEGAEHDRQ